MLITLSSVGRRNVVIKMSDLDKAERYYKMGNRPAHEVIMRELRDSGLVVYGAQAVNAHLPDWLDKATEDWDIFSTSPEETAKRLEELLDKRYGGDYFKVTPARHTGTFKVRSTITRREIADVTLPERKIDYKTIDGINYATLEYHVEQIKRILKDPKNKYRWPRDTETLQRIRVHRRATSRAGVIQMTTNFRGFKE